QVTPTGSQADIALRYFTNRLRASGTQPLAAGKLQPGDTTRRNPDLNTNLHVTTYAITLGARGTLFPTALDPFAVNVFDNPPTWPTLVADDPTMIDDLWHATVNGRGQMYMANDAEAMRVALQAAFGDILGQVGGQSGLAVTSINLQRGDSQAYLGTYTPAGWAGDLTANPIDVGTGEVAITPHWSAGTLLNARDWTTRVIASFNGSSGVGFTAANVGNIVNPSNTWGSNAAVVDYLRGARTGEGSTFRTRTSLVGAVINAEPVPSRDDKIVYLASGEGMLHAVDTETGREHWAFVPGGVLANLGQISSRDYAFRTKLAATPTLGKLAGSGNKILVGALGGAGRSYYALNVTSPRDMSETSLASAVMWQFPAATDTSTQAKMGYSYGRPVVAKTATQGDVVLVTSGYDNAQSIGDGKGRLWMLNATTGAIVREFVTTEGAVGAEAGLSQVSAYRETDGTVRHVYGGDLLGNLWHFDLDTGTVTRMARLKDSLGNAQPVTAAPELVNIADQRIVLIGTGRLLDISDFGNTKVQSFYAIADGAELSNARSGLISRTYTRGGTPELTGATIDWATQRGWFFDLPAG
ncbi:MAG: pyrrolo-quinoline quinone, partial [Burkholderiales bacterium PBB5]